MISNREFWLPFRTMRVPFHRDGASFQGDEVHRESSLSRSNTLDRGQRYKIRTAREQEAC
jgi:hypothetical protein